MQKQHQGVLSHLSNVDKNETYRTIPDRSQGEREWRDPELLATPYTPGQAMAEIRAAFDEANKRS
jgi:hypothetical protein